MEWIEAVIAKPAQTETEPNGRVRHWGYIEEIGKYLRVVVLEDRRTVPNAFPDRRVKRDMKK